MNRLRRLPIVACLLALAGSAAAEPTRDLSIGLQDDPDSLDPVTSWSFVGRHVLQSLCDKLVDIDAQGQIVPMLATSWNWGDGAKSLTLQLRKGVVFHDGTPFDAAAVRFNIDRALNAKATRRKSEIEAIETVEVIDPLTVSIKLKQPSTPVLAALSDRAGMMVSPTAAIAAGEDFSKAPVCAGPYRFIEHKAQDRIVLERFPDHWRAGEFTFRRLVFRGIPDANVRLVNLRAGQLQLIERLAPTDFADVAKDPSLRILEAPTLGYYGITFNMANGQGRNATVANSKLVREAIDLAIDREAINKVVFDGHFEAGNQPFPPSSPYYDRDRPMRGRDLAGARAKLKQAGAEGLRLELLVPSDPQRQQVAEVLQSMLADAGITLDIQRMELMSLLARAKDGNFQAYLVGWSGRVDPDLNVTPLLGCGAGGNDGQYCNRQLEAALAAARAVADPEERRRLYKVVTGLLLDDLPISYLYHGRWIYGARADLEGLRGYPDGIIRLNGVGFAK